MNQQKVAMLMENTLAAAKRLSLEIPSSKLLFRGPVASHEGRTQSSTMSQAS